MSVERVMGIETEYGISVPGDPQANPMVLSGKVVSAYARARGLRAAQAQWDYEDESPLRDARGWDLARGIAHPSQLTDETDPTLANVVLTNGARLYVDHAHPEYSSPEVLTPLDAVRWDRAGELVMRECVELLREPAPGINLYKNNTDGHGSSYGTHENYLMSRSTPFERIVTGLTPFFVVRQVICGSGKVGIGTHNQVPGYQLSQRSDFFEARVGLETTLKRPIINTRDEPHADSGKYRRLHVILGDANQADVANLLKMGMTSLVLGMIEDDCAPTDLEIVRPVETLREVSHDLDLQELVELADGRRMRPLDVLEAYFGAATSWVERTMSGAPDAATAQVLHLWGEVLDSLRTDPMRCADRLDWVGKLKVLQQYRERGGLDWADPRLRAIDIQWSDVRADKGIFNKLAAAGRFEQLVSDADALSAMTHPPADTRAWFRGMCIERLGDEVASASWDSVVFESNLNRGIARVGMPEPRAFTQGELGAIFDDSSNLEELLATLGRR